MSFDLDKKNILSRGDKSQKQSLDEDIISLVNRINQQQHYVTTSSCSGRISLWKEGSRKDRGEWVFVSHSLLNDDDRNKIKQLLQQPTQETLWLRAEPFIMHIACRSLEHAKSLLEQAKRVFKRSSLLAISNNPVLEVRGSEFLDMPLSQNEQLYVSQIDFFLDQANKKLRSTKQKTKQFESLFR